jgi:magnesium-transporting ATPase (P-type)
MFNLERTKKFVIFLFCLSALSFILTFVGYAYGGEELFRYGFMNNPGAAIMMFVSAGIFILSLSIGIGIRALSKDIVELLKYLDSKK